VALPSCAALPGNPKTWNPEPETRIRKPDIMNDDRNNSLQQRVIKKNIGNFFLLFIFFALLQPQIVIVKKFLTSSE